MSEVVESALLKAAEAHHQKIKWQAKGSAADALAAGRALLTAKAATPGKGWLAVLKNTTSMNPRTVQRYMLLARAMDAGLLGDSIDDMSFSHAYRLAVKQAVRIARKSTVASPGDRPAAATAEQNKALAEFRRAARVAISAGVPFKKLERELNERIGARILTNSLGTDESEGPEDQASHR
jgi:hypothetical protein